jgi:hypothetical protein
VTYHQNGNDRAVCVCVGLKFGFPAKFGVAILPSRSVSWGTAFVLRPTVSYTTNRCRRFRVPYRRASLRRAFPPMHPSRPPAMRGCMKLSRLIARKVDKQVKL